MPLFEGGIITERVGDAERRGLVPPDFRTRIPERVVDSGRIFREINGLEDVLQTKGSGASPEMLRTEMGVMYVYNLEAVLASQLAELDAVAASITTGAANTTGTTTFSFPQLPSGGPAAGHRIISAFIHVTSNVANFEAAELRAQPFGDPTAVTLDLVTSTEIRTSAISNGRRLDVGTLLANRQTDYTLRVRSNAGGSTTAEIDLLVAICPPGVAVPR